MFEENIPLVQSTEENSSIQAQSNITKERLIWLTQMMLVASIAILTVVFVVLITTRQLLSITPRIDCYPDAKSKFSNYSKEACLQRNCLYDDNPPSNVPQCYLNPAYGYIFVDEEQTQTGIRIKLKRNLAIGSMFPEPIDNIVLDVQYYTDDILRFKLYDNDNQRYEVPIPLTDSPGRASSPQYEFLHTYNYSDNNLFSFFIKRRGNKTILFDTSLGGLVLNNQFLQIVTRLQSPYIYGFGENNHRTLKHNVYEQQTWGIFARDQNTNWEPNTNHYSSHPFYVVMEKTPDSDEIPSGNMHGVLLLNSNAMDYSFGSYPSLTLRTIGGILDFFVFLGPKPEQVIEQYTWLIGRPIFPSYWSLGFQLSRWGYSNLTDFHAVIERNQNASVPFDVAYLDIDYMDSKKDFTIDQIHFDHLKPYVDQLYKDGIKTVIILDPGMIDDKQTYQPTIQGIQQDVFIRTNNDKTLIKGICWPGDVFLPDFFKTQTQTWWSQWINSFRRINLTFDGLWIDMNEPALFDTNEPYPSNSIYTSSNYTLKCPQNVYEDPPYRTKAVYRYDNQMDRPARLSDKTSCMSAIQGEADSHTNQSLYRHYDVHNLYGWSETRTTWQILKSLIGKRNLLLSRSTFVGSGQWTSHWFGDNQATWYQMKQSLILMVEFNWFGIPFNGADICGFDKIPTEEMCIRWVQLGAFYPFSRIHSKNEKPPQDPASWSTSATSIMIEAIRIRYTLLPYYYTLFYKAHTKGSTIIRPLFHEYPTDKTALDIYLQFLIGSHIMIAPVTDNATRQIDVYIPSSDWYDYYTGKRIQREQQFVTIEAPLEIVPILLRGGAILPTQEYASSTKYSREKPFGLIIILNENGQAEGDLFYDDGESLDTIHSKSYYYASFQWSSDKRQLSMNIIENNYPSMSKLMLNSLSIYGWNQIPKKMYADKKLISPTIKPNTTIIFIDQLSLPMNINHTITWDSSQ